LRSWLALGKRIPLDGDPSCGNQNLVKHPAQTGRWRLRFGLTRRGLSFLILKG
jgi:hypothetical protein